MKYPKGMKAMLKELTKRFANQRDAGMFLAIILDLLDSLTKEGDKELRTIKLELNGFFQITYDFDKDEVVKTNPWEERQ